MMKKFFMFVVALSLALVATSAFAQTTTTGSIEGIVTDPNGAAVKGATVTATSPNLISPQTATTNDSGRYQISNLPPGKYKVSIDAGGFAKWSSADFDVNLGRTSTADAGLQLATATATVQVTGGAAVDAAQNTTGSNVSTDQFSNFPTQRTVQGLYTIAPTVTRSGLRDAAGRDRDPSVAGSSGPENNYILDGVNTTDPAFGGSGANLPFEFVQEVEIKTGAYGAEYGKATGGIFNVVTKSGGNEFHGDIFGYGTTKGLVREVKNFPFTGAAANGFSETDLGGDIGGPIAKDKLWFFGAFNPQRRTNYYLTQTFFNPAQNKVTIPFYAGKLTWAINSKNTLTGSTFGDFTKIEGFLATGALSNVSGFGSDLNAFQGTQETGGHNYTVRLNSTIRNNFIAEVTGGLHFQRANTIPVATDQPLVTDNFAVLKGNAVLPVVQSGLTSGSTATGFMDYVDGRGGSLQRGYLRGPGFGLFGNQDRDRYEINAHMQNLEGKHTIKWGFEWFRVKYNIDTISSGPSVTYQNPLGVTTVNLPQGAVATNGVRITNSFGVCTVRGTVIVCPSSTSAARLTGGATSDFATGVTVATNRFTALGITGVQLNSISSAEAFGNPFLVRTTTRVRDFQLHANTWTNAEAFYIQDDYKFARDFQFNFGVRWDYEQAYNANGSTYIKFNNFWDNLAPRLGLVWDFTHKGKGKLYANYATFIESPIPLDVNVRAAGGDSQTDKNFNVNTYSAPASATIATGFTPVNLGADATPLDPGLKPPSIGEYTMGLEYEIAKDLALSFRGVYRHERNVVEDGSFDDGNTYFIFNPGRNEPGTTEAAACAGDASTGRIPRCFGRAQRFYRAFEVSATKRFTNHWQMITSYVYSSLTGNYEGLFRNDNGQSDPNITSLFDLQSLLDNTYGRLPNDRPHQFKFNGSYQFPFRLMLSGNFYWQTGTPFNQLIPHPVYGNNEGFAVQRGTAVVPTVTATQPGFPNIVDSIGSNRTPSTMNLDLGVYYPIKIGEKKELRLTGDWFNVFNQQRAVTLDQTYSLNSGVTGVPPVLNPFWGSALLVQAPSAFRFGAKFTF
ncbi:MAG TPA: TonB-dependent receptor [Pyrinomonadaceae bacterium]|nr:TonB-dependent receptor [Pyrinomonadaceae bacterium]